VVLAIAIAAGWTCTAVAQGVAGNISGAAGVILCCSGEIATARISGGAEVPITDALGVGGEVSLVAPLGDAIITQAHSSHDFGRFTALSLNVLYRFKTGKRAAKARPYITVGADEVFAGDAAVLAWHVGGGSDWWLRDRRGIRVEIRDQFLREFGTTQVLTAAIGVIFR
jgi:hypothetical protein